MNGDTPELKNLKEAMDKIFLKGNHFSEVHKKIIIRRIQTSHARKLDSIIPKVFIFSLSILFMIVSSVFTYQVIAPNISSDNALENEHIVPQEKVETKTQDQQEDTQTVSPSNDSNTNSNSETKTGPKTLAALSIGKSVKGTGDLVTEVVAVREVPTSEIQTEQTEEVLVGVTIRLENRGNENLSISANKTMKLANAENELQPIIKIDKTLENTLEPGQNIQVEIVFDTSSSEKYKFYFVDLSGEQQTVWLFDYKDL
ncbi:DUF4352 domain-containing protein [Robertmurraya kyonggiensis]|uniref:DUF4352 domain-containing protein n=1 Tax=Robertmurraya kyonggiensis TaxID=1037680 RepID=A0A4U1DAN6_9BACI|nr:DUF4352 domain-containing protein [Robertmurraya kyonggiensis]TKC19621.1 DUF4352 domain-containing protein [Robertmurraya kyonggiensis]